jgi:TolB protein
VRLKEAFGPDAELRASFGVGERRVLAVGLEALPEASDALPGVALATFDVARDELAVLDTAPRFREARLLGQRAALVTTDAELILRGPDGVEQLLAQGVRGDLSVLPEDRGLALTLLGPDGDEGETAIAVVDLSGELRVLADGEGVDDRPLVSPDGRTVVFVSGRTGVASLYRTSLDGEEPVQLTNTTIEAGVERDEEPADFVPPPVDASRATWVTPDVLRYDAGGGEYWRVDVRTGAATREGGAR